MKGHIRDEKNWVSGNFVGDTEYFQVNSYSNENFNEDQLFSKLYGLVGLLSISNTAQVIGEKNFIRIIGDYDF